MIIVEGPDGVGKTTACTRLSMISGWPVEHMSKPPKSFRHYTDYMLLATRNAIWDRFHLGSFAYGAIVSHEGQDQCYERLRAAIRTLDFFGVTTVIMYSSDTEALRTSLEHDDRPQMYDIEKILAVNEVYRWMAEHASDSNAFRGICFAHICHDVSMGYPEEAQLEYWVEVARARARGAG